MYALHLLYEKFWKIMNINLKEVQKHSYQKLSTTKHCLIRNCGLCEVSRNDILKTFNYLKEQH